MEFKLSIRRIKLILFDERLVIVEMLNIILGKNIINKLRESGSIKNMIISTCFWFLSQFLSISLSIFNL